MRFKGICLITKKVNKLKNFYKDIFQVETEEEADDVDKEYERLKERQVSIVKRPTTQV